MLSLIFESALCFKDSETMCCFTYENIHYTMILFHMDEPPHMSDFDVKRSDVLFHVILLA